MKSTNLCNILFLLAVAACGAKSSGGNKSPAETNQFSSPLSYSFSEKDESPCKTGKQSYSSLKDLCMGLQDDGKNNSCAVISRLERFQKVCEPEGFRWIESAQCDLYVMKKGSEPGVVRVKDVIKKVSVCAGRMEALGWKFQERSVLEGELYKGSTFKLAIEPMIDARENFSPVIVVSNLDGRIAFEDSNLSNLGFGGSATLGFEGGETIRYNCQRQAACKSP